MSVDPSVEDTDVVIVGAGMVGGVLAWSLAGSGLQVTLVERTDLQATAANAGERSTALSWGSRQLLEAVSLWTNLSADSCAIKRIHVSQQGHLGSVQMNSQDHRIEALGYVVRNATLLHNLSSRLPNIDNLTILAPAHITAFSQCDREAQLVLNNGQKIRAKLVVVVDGSESNTRQMVGIDTDVECYDQHAIVATLTAVGTPEHMAWERFTADGPMALLPLGGNQLSLVYTVSSEQLHNVQALSDHAFIEKVQAGIGRRIGRIKDVSVRQAFPLQRVSVGESWQKRVVLLGNAARTLHPVAGQGFNLALRDAMTLAELLQGLAAGQDAGAEFIREQYLSHRRSDQQETIGLTDVLARTFRGQSSMLGHLRGAALIATDRLPLLRRGFARRSMGLAHRIPKVAAPIL